MPWMGISSQCIRYVSKKRNLIGNAAIMHINQISFNNLFSFKLQVMAKVEELNKSMGPAYRIADQVKDIKRLLDLFENAMNEK